MNNKVLSEYEDRRHNSKQAGSRAHVTGVEGTYFFIMQYLFCLLFIIADSFFFF